MERFTKCFVVIFATIFVAAGLLTLNSCQEDEEAHARVGKMADTTEVYIGYAHESTLIHHWDSTRRTSVKDEMDALLKVWQTVDGDKDYLLYNNTVHPEFDATSLLRHTEYNITEDQLDPKVTATWLARANNENHELDTLYVDFSDGQRDSIPVDITSFDAEVNGNKYNHGTMTVVDAHFISLTNLPIETRSTRAGAKRAPYVARSVNTEYKAMITLREKNLHGDNVTPQTFNVPVYAYAVRHIMRDDAITGVTVENKNRVIINDTTERCSFDKVLTYESGDVVRENIQIILNREFKGIDTYEKAVSNFDFNFNRSKGVSKGTDATVREDGKWLVNGRTDRYAASITNGVAEDAITTDYSLYHERAVYTDGDFVVEFGYEDVRCNELETTVTKQGSGESGKSKALEHNKIQTVYLGYTQDLAEDVILVMTSKLVSGYEIANTNLKVFNDSVVATLDFITKYNDGTKDTEHERFSAPRSLVCTTDWSSTQVQATQTTDETVNITMTSSNEKKQGYWKFTEQTRRLDNYAHLSDESSKHNSWTAVVPNSISYTREGKTHDFGVLSFATNHVKATLTTNGTGAAGESYKYTEEIKVRYQDNNQNISAPGKLLVNGSQVRGYEIRDKKLVVDNDKVTASLTFVTVFMDGAEDKDPVSKTFPRSLKVNTNWSAVETTTANQTTGQPTILKTAMQSKTDDEWKWNEETRSITTVATLASSTQNNNWTSVDPNNIVFTRNGQTVDFGTIAFSAVYVNATTTQTSKSALVETYDYANTISVTFSDNTQTTVAPGTIRIDKNKAVVDHEIRDAKLVISENDVTASLTFVTLWNDGSESTEAIVKSFPRTLNPYTNWTANESTNSENTGAAVIEDFVKKNMTDGNWSYVREERDIVTKVTLAGSTQENGWTSVEPNSIVYTREGKTHAFGEINFNAKEDGHETVLGNSSATIDVYNYTDKLTVTYGDNTTSVTAPGTINVRKDITVIGYEIINQNLDVQQNGVTATLDFITKFSDGSTTSEKIKKFFERRFNVITDWSSYEANNSQTTSATTVTLDNAENKKDGDWSYVNETRNISTIATLAGSTQRNSWTSVDPNSIIFTRNGQTYAFMPLSFSASETGAKVDQTSDDNIKTVYSYTDNISVSYGSNNFASSAPGTISVKKAVVITGYEITNQKLDVKQHSVTATLDFVTKFSDGTQESENMSKTFARSFSVLTDWSSDEANNSQTTSATTVTLDKSENKQDGDWSYVNETRSISTTATLAGSTQNNGWTSVDPNSITFTKNGQTYTFETISFSASETGADVSQSSEDLIKVIYSYKDNISVTFGSNTFASSAPGTIRVTKPVVVVGYEILNKNLTVSQNSVTASLDFVTKFSDGTENKEAFSKTFPRSLTVTTNWTAIETSTAEQTTSQPTATKTGNEAKTEDEWSWNVETRSISSIATLASSAQNNNWTSVDPNNIVFTKNGQTADFGTIAFSVVYVNATTSFKEKSGLTETYTYSNAISVNFSDNMQTTVAPGTIRIERAKEVTDHEIRDAKMVITDSSVDCSLTFVTLWNDGSETTEAVNKSFPRTLNPYTNWTADEDNANETTGTAVIEDLFKKNMTEGNWSYVREERDIITKVTLTGSTKENGWTSVEPNSIVYTREGKTHAFGAITFNAKEDGHEAVLNSTSATLDVYNYTDKLTVTYGANTISSTAPGTINVTKPVVAIDYEIANQSLDVQQNGVTATLDFITKFSDGTSTSEKIQKFFERRFNVITNWSSVETNNSQSTSATTVTLDSSENKEDGEWSYVNETRSISTTATLAGSTQINGWTSVDPNSISFARNGKTYTFSLLSFSASETGANVSQTSEDEDKTVYSYTDNISVTFGSNSFSSSAPGAITVNKPWDSDFPKEWGKFVDCKFTVAPDENRKTWVYTWSIHFENGTLPVVVRKNATEAEINTDYFTSETDSRLNGGYYVKSKKAWVNTIANDGTDWMEWLNTSNQNQGNMAYSTATAWGWDNGAQNNGHPSVFTNRFTAKITNNNLVLTIYKNGTEFASYKAGK